MLMYPILVHGQSIDKINQERKRQEAKLEMLTKQIKEFDVIIQNKKKDELISQSTIETIAKQLVMQKNLMEELGIAQEKTSIDIIDNQKELQTKIDELENIKTHFKKFVIGIYKYGTPTLWESILTSSSLTQGFARTKYIRVFQDIVKIRFQEIAKKIGEIGKIKQTLDDTYQYNQRLLVQKEQQVQSYQEKKLQKEKYIKQLQAEQKKIAEKKRKYEQQLEVLKQQIQKLIASENQAIENERKQKQKKLAQTKKSTGTPSLKTKTEEKTEPFSEKDQAFLNTRGKFSYPVREGVVIRPFGKNQMENSKVETKNNGIDISIKKPNEVHVIDDGKVSLISYLPTFGNIVIIRHAESFITVYANIENIKVVRTAMIKKNAVLGTVAKNTLNDSYILHFEIWKGRDPYNPEDWLSKNL